jgi:hypothetical protein
MRDMRTEAIGAGYQNTLKMVLKSSTGNRAGTISRAYRGPNNLSDWYLPSVGELKQLYIQKSLVQPFKDWFYWSSSEFGAGGAWSVSFFLRSDGEGGFLRKDEQIYVRPIRAF